VDDGVGVPCACRALRCFRLLVPVWLVEVDVELGALADGGGVFSG
jgi:hypothetical protein